MNFMFVQNPKRIRMFVLFASLFCQETEQDELKDLEDYKVAKSLLDSVELEQWFPDESLWDSVASTLHSLCRTLNPSLTTTHPGLYHFSC